MDLQSCVDFHHGKPFNMVLDWEESIDQFHFGREVPFGEKFVFHHEGDWTEKRMTLYNAKWMNQKMGNAWMLDLDPKFPPLGHQISNKMDFGKAHDVCCGLGGFSSALSAIGLRSISAVDTSTLATSAFVLNHDAPVFCEDIGSIGLVHKLHGIQLDHKCQPLMCGGFPCQPLSSQGSQLRGADPRSQTLRSLLRSAFWLQCSGVLLECVQEAMSDQETQHSIKAFANLMGFKVLQKVIHLHHIWPSRRTRWFALLVPLSLDLTIEDLPKVEPAPVVKDLMPFDLWPLWTSADEHQLKWTEIELQAYRNPEFGNTDRRIKGEHPLPTALHSWGSAVTSCPCKCRNQGLSPFSLRL